MRSWRVSESRRSDAGVWLLLALPALLPFGSAAELPLLIAAMLGVVAIARRRIDWQAPGPRLALVLFLAYWLPELVSAFDSVAPRKSWTEVAADLRFLPFLLFALLTLDDVRRTSLFLGGIGMLLGAWLIDALVQAATGWSLGGANPGDRLSGIFGDDNLKLGGVVAALAPFLLLPAARRFGAVGLLAAFLPVLLVVLLAGARAGWIVLALATALVLWQRFGPRRGALALVLVVVVASVAGVAANAWSPRFAERIDRTAAVLAGEPAAIDHALAGRLPIWRTALAMGTAHPLNGVGVRGFRHAYPAHAQTGDPWVDAEQGIGALHAHQLVLELVSETGVFGLLCWIAGVGYAFRAWRVADVAARERAAAPAIALFATLFPLNTHYAVYSSFWSLLLVLLLASGLAALHVRDAAQRAS
jgi:O-antigen ligase